MEIKLNLASKPYLNRQRLRFWLLLVCALLSGLLTINGIYAYRGYQQLERLADRSQELERQASGVQAVSVEYSQDKHDDVRLQVAKANDIVAADQFHWTSLLNRFEELLPSEVSIRSIQPNFKEHSLQLACVASDVTAMARFVDNLLSSEDLNQTFLQQHGESAAGKAGINKVQISFSLLIREAF